MKKPLIALTPLLKEGYPATYMLDRYSDAIEGAGGIPVTLPVLEAPEDYKEIVDRFDGFLFTGGPDVDPALYGEEELPECGEIAFTRDRIEIPLLHTIHASGRPILGICRGIQLINVALGGSLYQDLPSQTGTPVEHKMAEPFQRTCHSVTILPDTPLVKLLGKEHLEVNSIHHQGVKAIGKNLRVMAYAEDGLVEAYYEPDYPFLWGVQWHPEHLFGFDPDSQKIFGAFISACRKDET